MDDNNYLDLYRRNKQLYLNLLLELNGGGRGGSKWFYQNKYKKTTEYLLYLTSICENISTDPHNLIYKFDGYDYKDGKVFCCCCGDESTITFDQVNFKKSRSSPRSSSRSSPRSGSPTSSDSESIDDTESPKILTESHLLRTLGHNYPHSSFMDDNKAGLPMIFKRDDLSGGYVVQNILFMCKICNNTQDQLTFEEFFKYKCVCGRPADYTPVPILPTTITFIMPDETSFIIEYQSNGNNNQIKIANDIYKLFDFNRSSTRQSPHEVFSRPKLFMGLKKFTHNKVG